MADRSYPLCIALLVLSLGACSSDSGGPASTERDGPPVVRDAGSDLAFFDGATTRDGPFTPDAATVDAPAEMGGDASGDLLPDDAPGDDTAIEDATGDAPPADAALNTLTIEIEGEGTVELDPGAEQCSDADSPCSVEIVADTTVTLTATPGVDHAFDHWSGDCSGTDTATAVTLDGAKSCRASFLKQTGEIGLIPAPASVVPNTTEDDVKMMLFIEQADLELSQPLAFDSHVPGTFTARLGNAGGELPAGTRVNVYFLHFDPVSSAGVTRVGTLVLPQPVLALSYVETTLDATDAQVGHPDVTYPTAGTHPDRDLELTGQDEFTLGDDRRTLAIDYYTSTSSDQIRIITAASGTLSLVHSSQLAPTDPAPGDVRAGGSEDSGAALLFEESASTLAADLTVDVDAPGSYTTGGSLTGGSVAGGTTVKSYLIHFDPVGTTAASVTASVTFDREILGLVLGASNLDASDALGAGGTTYPTGTDADRATEIGTGDTLVFYGDRRSVRLSLSAGSSIDQIRVLVAAP